MVINRQYSKISRNDVVTKLTPVLYAEAGNYPIMKTSKWRYMYALYH